ncbi:hypothetical protein ABT095_15090 [Kitasatospora sp. NPDC002227]|uniref:hypothetical protein n=1 Tax=Kitasatospora sp. NPDC002227 TaxID=3154773 RepID=UPI0033189F42
MGDRSPLQVFVHAADPDQHDAVLKVLTDHGLDLEYEFPEIADGQLALGIRYFDVESGIDPEDLWAALIDAAPSAVFELWLDPFPAVYDGLYIGHVPDIGTYRVECNSDGTPLVNAAKLAEALAALPEEATVAQWLAGPGTELLGTAVRARLSQYERRTV